MEPLQHKKKKEALFRRLTFAAWLLAVAAFSLSLGAKRLAVCDYVSVNGDWQSFNVFRRILAGQRPYADFANYIGMAPVWVNLPWLLVHGDFARSLFVTNFTANLLFSLAVFCLVYLAVKKPLPAFAVSALFSKLVSTQILRTVPGGGIGGWLTDTFTGLYTPSNSMRAARSWLPFALMLGILLWNRLFPKRRCDVREIFRTPIRCAGCGFLLGFFITWSSDYGLACIAAGSVIFLFLQLGVYRPGAKAFFCRLAAYAVAMAAGVFLSAVCVTGGSPAAWFSSLSATGEYQYFYFNGTGSQTAVGYLFSCGRFWVGAAFCIAFLLVCTVRLFRNRLSESGLMLYFIMASVLAGTIAYILAGSGYNAREPLEGYSVILALSLALRGLYALAARRAPTAGTAGEAPAGERSQRLPFSAAVCCLVLAGCCLLGGKDAVQAWGGIGSTGTFLPALGGTSTYTRALIEADTLTGCDAVFSVYATGLEAVKGQFQPTGCDYIIHALGEDMQTDYVAAFTQGNYPWVQTPDLPVDGWVGLQNWYFYRSVWAGYEKAESTEYSWLWKRAGDCTLDATAEVQVLDNGDGSVTLACTSSHTGSFIADVRICYALTGGSAVQRAMNLGRGSVYAATGSLYADDDTYSGFCMPAEGVQYVPVIMENGSGSVRLSSLYRGGGSVTVESAEVQAALPRWNLYTADCAA